MPRAFGRMLEIEQASLVTGGGDMPIALTRQIEPGHATRSDIVAV